MPCCGANVLQDVSATVVGLPDSLPIHLRECGLRKQLLEPYKRLVAAYRIFHGDGKGRMDKWAFANAFDLYSSAFCYRFHELIVLDKDKGDKSEVDFVDFLLGVCMFDTPKASTSDRFCYAVLDWDGDGTITSAEARRLLASEMRSLRDAAHGGLRPWERPMGNKPQAWGQEAWAKEGADEVVLKEREQRYKGLLEMMDSRGSICVEDWREIYEKFPQVFFPGHQVYSTFRVYAKEAKSITAELRKRALPEFMEKFYKTPAGKAERMSRMMTSQRSFKDRAADSVMGGVGRLRKMASRKFGLDQAPQRPLSSGAMDVWSDDDAGGSASNGSGSRRGGQRIGASGSGRDKYLVAEDHDSLPPGSARLKTSGSNGNGSWGRGADGDHSVRSGDGGSEGGWGNDDMRRESGGSAGARSSKELVRGQLGSGRNRDGGGGRKSSKEMMRGGGRSPGPSRTPERSPARSTPERSPARGTPERSPARSSKELARRASNGRLAPARGSVAGHSPELDHLESDLSSDAEFDLQGGDGIGNGNEGYRSPVGGRRKPSRPRNSHGDRPPLHRGGYSPGGRSNDDDEWGYSPASSRATPDRRFSAGGFEGGLPPSQRRGLRFRSASIAGDPSFVHLAQQKQGGGGELRRSTGQGLRSTSVADDPSFVHLARPAPAGGVGSGGGVSGRGHGGLAEKKDPSFALVPAPSRRGSLKEVLLGPDDGGSPDLQDLVRAIPDHRPRTSGSVGGAGEGDNEAAELRRQLAAQQAEVQRLQQALAEQPRGGGGSGDVERPRTVGASASSRVRQQHPRLPDPLSIPDFDDDGGGFGDEEFMMAMQRRAAAEQALGSRSPDIGEPMPVSPSRSPGPNPRRSGSVRRGSGGGSRRTSIDGAGGSYLDQDVDRPLAERRMDPLKGDPSLARGLSKERGGGRSPGPGGRSPGPGGRSPGLGGRSPGPGGRSPGLGGRSPGPGGRSPGLGGQSPGGYSGFEPSRGRHPGGSRTPPRR